MNSSDKFLNYCAMPALAVAVVFVGYLTGANTLAMIPVAAAAGAAFVY